MYIPATFNEARVEVLYAFIRQHSFATLVTCGEGGMQATHLPVLLDEKRGERGVLVGHLAVGNGQWREMEKGGEVMVVFAGPHAYVSPGWYETKLSVPTWNYAVVHVYGRGRVVGAGMLRGHLTELVEKYEGVGEGAWGVAGLPEEFLGKMERGIVGFEVEITRIEGKWKMGQNRTIEDRRGVIAGLKERGGADDLKVARMMEEGLGEKLETRNSNPEGNSKVETREGR